MGLGGCLLEFFFENYNGLRPHYALGIFTTDEIYEGASPGNPFSHQYQIAAQNRRKVNQKSSVMSSELCVISRSYFLSDQGGGSRT